MREIRTSGSMREEEPLAPPLLDRFNPPSANQQQPSQANLIGWGAGVQPLTSTKILGTERFLTERFLTERLLTERLWTERLWTKKLLTKRLQTKRSNAAR